MDDDWDDQPRDPVDHDRLTKSPESVDLKEKPEKKLTSDTTVSKPSSSAFSPQKNQNEHPKTTTAISGGANNLQTQENKTYLGEEGRASSSLTGGECLSQEPRRAGPIEPVTSPEEIMGRWQKLKQRLLPARMRQRLK